MSPVPCCVSIIKLGYVLAKLIEGNTEQSDDTLPKETMRISQLPRVVPLHSATLTHCIPVHAKTHQVGYLILFSQKLCIQHREQSDNALPKVTCNKRRQSGSKQSRYRSCLFMHCCFGCEGNNTTGIGLHLQGRAVTLMHIRE